MIRRQISIFSIALLCMAASPVIARADFGIAPGSLTMSAVSSDGTTESQAGSHPFAFSLQFELNTSGTQTEGGEMRDFLVDLPPGMIGNPQAVPTCPRQSFEGGRPSCAPSTQVGVGSAILPGLGKAIGPLYNITPPPGVAAQLGFSNLGLTLLPEATVQSEEEEGREPYGVHVATLNLPLEVSSVSATIWGNPADPEHTPERGPTGGKTSDAPQLAYFTLPTSCGAPPEVTVRADSKLAPGVFASQTTPLSDSGGNPVSLTGCESVPFKPTVASGPSTIAAGSASGLAFELGLPNQGLLVPDAVTETEPLKTVVTLPRGITANPAAASGLGACTPAQYKAASATNPGCPPDSKLGTLFATSPLLEEAIEGSVYLAAPHDNPFNSLLALYIIAKAPERGVVVKQAGEVHPDPTTGQLETTFDGLPPLPYSSFEVRLREGPRAPLITPETCGTYTTTARLYPFSDPGTATERSAPFTISSGANGGACASSEAGLPNHPTLLAGTTLPLAGAYSPFLFKLSREDGEQRFSSLEATLPEGLLGKLAGIPYCPDAAIAAATARSGEGQGAAELTSPSCPAASQVGTVLAGAGAGPSPYYVQGNAYLAGPYKGAPLSLAIITPAIAGPFDLGNVVVRSGLYVNETNAKVSVKSDPLPTILHGLPLDIRSVAVRMDRQNFTLNPTSCEEKAISAELTSTSGAVAQLSNRFGVSGCRNLGFKPRFSLKLKGGTKRAANPKLIATLSPREGDANIAALSVQLPRSAFLDQSHIRTVCTRVQFAADVCPPGSVYGKVSVQTPILGYELKGDVYLRSSSHKLPDLVADLRGPASQPIRIQLSGRTDSVKGALRNSFDFVPDAPFSSARLELFGGKRGLVVNSRDLCAHPYRATVDFEGQNGKEHKAKPLVQSDCGQGRKRKRS